MKLLIIILSLFASAFCKLDESLASIPCINSRVVVEEKPDITYFRITADSGEQLLDLNSHITVTSDVESLLSDLNLLLFPEEGHYLYGNSSDYFIINNQTGAENEVSLVSRPGVTVFKKVLPLQSVPITPRCAHIYGFNLVIDPTFDITKPDGYNATALLWSSFFGLSDLAKSLVERGADVNQKSYIGLPPLAAAIAADQTDLTEFLIQKGASISVDVGRSNLGMLLVAAYKGRANISRILIEHGADVNQASTPLHLTPLHAAADYGHCNVIKLLISKGANPNAVTAEGKTPLHLAGIHPISECVHGLIDGGAYIDARDNDGNTPLMLNLDFEENEADALETVEHVLGQHNPDISIRNNKGETLLSIAVRKGFTKVAELLKSRGAA